MTTRPLRRRSLRTRSPIRRSFSSVRLDERLHADIVALLRLREQLVDRALGLDVGLVAGGEHLVRLVLRRLHVGLVERVDLEEDAGDGDGELPAEELAAERVRIGDLRPAACRSGPSGDSPGAGTRPLPCLPVDSAISCSAQRPKPPSVSSMQILSRPSCQPVPNCAAELVARVAARPAGRASAIRSAFASRRATSMPISAAGTMPNGESAE